MPDLYAIDVQLIATLYVKADDAAEAKRIALDACLDAGMEMSRHSGGDIEIFGGAFDSEDLPDVSFSPAMTVMTPTGEAWLAAGADELHGGDEDEDDDEGGEDGE